MGPFIPEGVHVFFSSDGYICSAKNSQGGKLHVRTLLRYRMCDDGAATFQHLQIFNHAGRNANRIVFTAKCLLNGRVAFAKQASAFPSSLSPSVVERSLMCASTSPTRARLIPGQRIHPRRRARA